MCFYLHLYFNEDKIITVTREHALTFHRRSRWPESFLSHILGVGTRRWSLYDLKFELGLDVLTMHLPPSFIIVQKLSSWQTNKQKDSAEKHPHRSSSTLRRWKIIPYLINYVGFEITDKLDMISWRHMASPQRHAGEVVDRCDRRQRPILSPDTGIDQWQRLYSSHWKTSREIVNSSKFYSKVSTKTPREPETYAVLSTWIGLPTPAAQFTTLLPLYFRLLTSESMHTEIIEYS